MKKFSMALSVSALFFSFSSIGAELRFPGPQDLYLEKEAQPIPTFLLKQISEFPDSIYRIWVFFTDKGIRDGQDFRESLEKFKRSLSERSIRRRAKVRPWANLVDFRDLPLNQDYIDMVLSLGAKERAVSRWLNAISVEARGREIELLAALPFVRALRRVRGYKRDRGMRIDGPPKEGSVEGHYSIYYGPSLNQLEQIKVPLLHEIGFTGDSVVVLMLDTGFRRTHNSLSHLNVLAEHDFINDDDTTWNQPGDPPSQDSHGTITLSTIAGFAPGELVGPAFDALFLLAKTEDVSDEQPIEEDWWVEGLEWGDSLGAEIVSSSLGYIDWYSYEDLNGDICVTTVAADIAAQNGILVVTAIGNGGPELGTLIAPSDADSIVAVGAVDSEGVLASFSSRGPTYDGRTKPEVCAQGVSTVCASPGDSPDEYIMASGTSLSTPLIAGLSALLLQVHPEWGPMDIREALISTASQADSPDNNYGWGIADGFSASGLEIGIPLLESIALFDTFPEDNQDGSISPGERASLSFTISNRGNIDIPSLQGILRTEDTRVWVVDSLVTFGLLHPDSLIEGENPAVIEAPEGTYPGFDVTFTLELIDTTRSWQRSFVLSVRSTGEWIKASWNPIIENGGDDWYSYRILEGTLLKTGDTLKLWFSGLDEAFNGGGTSRIGYAYSLDEGLTWSVYPDPVFEPGYNWDSYAVMGPCVVPSGDSLLMFYIGSEGYPGVSWYNSGIGLASSQDGIHWTRLTNDPVIKGSSADWDYNPYGRPWVIEEQGGLRIFYTALDGSGYSRMGEAFSEDARNWTERNVIFEAQDEEHFDGRSVKDSWALNEDRWFIYYAGEGVDGKWRIGVRTSFDRTQWEHMEGPGEYWSFLTPGLTGSWDDEGVSSPSLVKLESGTWAMLYVGTGQNGSGLGLAFNPSTFLKEAVNYERDRGALRLSVFPNPARERVIFYLNPSPGSGPIKVRIYGVNGREVFREDIDPGKVGFGPWKIERGIRNLSSGLYFLKVEGSRKSALSSFILLR